MFWQKISSTFSFLVPSILKQNTMPIQKDKTYTVYDLLFDCTCNCNLNISKLLITDHWLKCTGCIPHNLDFVHFVYCQEK